MVALASEPGVASLGGGAFLTIAPAGARSAVTVDGSVEMPGRGVPGDAFGAGLRDVLIGYGGGTAMSVGHGSVATPGALAAFEEAHRRYGRLPWRLLVEPATEVAASGFPLGTAAEAYLEHARDPVFGWSPATRAALYHRDGRPVRAGETVRIDGLADFLAAVAEQGSAALHRGEVARAIAADMAENGGLLTAADLADYRPVVRPALPVRAGRWRLGTNPAPSIGGPLLAAMVLLMEGRPAGPWTPEDVAHLVQVQLAVLRHRPEHRADVRARSRTVAALLSGILAGGQRWRGSPSTLHVSAVDAQGAACAVTASSGYGSGVCAPGTGVWLNNCLGEHELTPGGRHDLPPGRRLISNMAPTVGRRDDGAVLAIGSPGAERITTALLQVLAPLVADPPPTGPSRWRRTGPGNEPMSVDADWLQRTIDRPRLHVRLGDGTRQPVVDHEADLSEHLPGDLSALVPGVDWQQHPARSMYFGGVCAAMRDASGALFSAADPRRNGATAST